MKFQIFEINDLALTLRSKATLSRKLRGRGDEIERLVKALSSSLECLSLHLALDLWQSQNKPHYLGSTGIINLCQETLFRLMVYFLEDRMKLTCKLILSYEKTRGVRQNCNEEYHWWQRNWNSDAISFDSIETEWNAYMRSLRSMNAPGFDTISFWRMESDRYPKLSKVARGVFAFSATSTSYERSFSLARNKIGLRRQRLSPLNLQRLMRSSYNRIAICLWGFSE
jgi:hypothetical protein